jgi:anti-anti-sigma factor
METIMTNTTFKATVRKENGNAVLDMQGDINSFAETRLNAAYAEADEHNPETIVLNFEAVDYINSTGIALIVGLLAKARVSHRSLCAVGLSEHYREIFKITRLSDFITLQ